MGDCSRSRVHALIGEALATAHVFIRVFVIDSWSAEFEIVCMADHEWGTRIHEWLACVGGSQFVDGYIRG